MNKLFFLISFFSISLSGFTIDSENLKLRSFGIGEDIIVDSMKYPRPLSVTNAINYIDEKINLNEVKNIDISRNNIGLIGATKLLNFINNKIENIEVIDLSYNKISDNSFNTNLDIYNDFEKILKEILQKESLKTINLSDNRISNNETWVSHINNYLGTNLIEKLVFKSKG